MNLKKNILIFSLFLIANKLMGDSFENINLKEIVKTYKNNEFRFEKKYKNKKIEVEVKFEKIVKAIFRIPGITTKWNLIASTSEKVGIVCPLQDDIVERLYEANEGDRLLVSGNIRDVDYIFQFAGSEDPVLVINDCDPNTEAALIDNEKLRLSKITFKKLEDKEKCKDFRYFTYECERDFKTNFLYNYEKKILDNIVFNQKSDDKICRQFILRDLINECQYKYELFLEKLENRIR